MTKEKSDEIIEQLKKIHDKFTFTQEPGDHRIRALTEFIAFTPHDLRRLAKIIEGQLLNIKRSGTKIKISVW